MIEQTPDDPRPYNTTVVISDQGELVASHRKCQLYDAFSYRESDHFRPGMSRFTPIQTPFGTLGLIVCYELRYPELARLQAIEAFSYRESDHFRPGMSRFTPIQTPFGTLGLIVCYELRYPELARLQAIEGAEFLLVTAAFVCGKQKAQQWHTLLAARAVENGCFVLGCNHVKPKVFLGESSAYAPDGQTIMECGDTPELMVAARAVENGCFVLGCNHVKPKVFLGESSAYAPDGQTIMECGDTPELMVVTCDRSQIGTVRENCPVLRQRREDLYSLK